MAKFPILTAEQLSAVVDLREVEMDIEEWQASIRLKAFNIDQRDHILSACTEKDGTVDAKKLVRLLVVHGVVEPKLSLEVIASKSYAVIERIAQEIMTLNGMSKDKGASASTVADVTFRPES